MEEFKKPLLPSCPLLKCENDNKFNVEETVSNVKQEVQEPNPSSKLPTQNCPYKVPNWSGISKKDDTYAFEVLKSGQIIDEVKNLQTKAYWTFGRLPENDIEMAHPTISRYHAILQYRPKTEPEGEDNDEGKNNTEKGPPEGWYVYDLDSTHGTFLNKQRVPSKVFMRIRVGYILRLGASTRSYILQGPTEDEEPESELSITELKAKRQRELEETALKNKLLEDEAAERARNEGCGWGMGDDADEETDLTHNPFATTNNEELFLDDPKKTLRGYFEREGLQMEYKCDEMSAGSFVCRVELPLDNENGRPIIAEVVHKGKKKDCVVQCALEACRILDRHGVLRQANQEPLRRKQKLQGSDSDEDEFWDRTGDVARKKQRKATVATNVTLTYENLLKQEADLNKELDIVVSNIMSYQEQQKQLKVQKELEEQNDDLDSFMENLKAKETPMDKTEIKKLRFEEQRLNSEIKRTQRLIKIAKPVDMPFGKTSLNDNLPHHSDKRDIKTRQLPLIGKRNQFSKFKVVKQLTTDSIIKSTLKSNYDSAEEEDEDAEEYDTTNSTTQSKYKANLQDVFERSEKLAIDKEQLKGLENIDTDIEFPSKQHHPKSPQTNLNDDTKHIRDIAENITDKHSPSDFAEPHTSEIGKKRRHRLRLRGKRQEVDEEDEGEHESNEKYAKWVPPENQTGDGFTELNEKFGY